jgi:hypothetical protein
MTAPRDPDEIVSAIVDGELAVDEVERAMAEPEVARRVAELENTRALLRDLPPAPDIGRAGAVAAALDAVAPAPPTGGQVPPGLGEGIGRSGHPRWLVAAVAASVVILALVAGVALLQGGDGGGDTFAAGDADTAEEADDAPGAAADDFDNEMFETGEHPDDGAAQDESAEAPPDLAVPGDEGEEFDAEPRDMPEAGAAEPSGWLDLGTVNDSRDLERRVTAVLRGDSPAAGRTTDISGDASCPASQVGGDPDEGRAGFSATAELDGERVWVQVYPRDDGRARLVATDTDCRNVVDQVISP